MGLRIYFDTSSHETLLTINKKLSLENAILTKDNKNLTDQLGNLTQVYTVSESNNKNLSAGVQELNTRNQELETEKKNCLGNTDKKCYPCHWGWLLTGLSCIEINEPPSSGWKTWAEAQEDCSGKNSNLADVHILEAANNTESYRGNRYWIGLRVVNKKWEWVDGSDLTDSSWIDPPDDGHCAVYYNSNYWYSVSCEEKQQWICKKKALSV